MYLFSSMNDADSADCDPGGRRGQRGIINDDNELCLWKESGVQTVFSIVTGARQTHLWMVHLDRYI